MTARILVVDDLQPNVKLLEAKLNSEYYDVLTASNGLEALRITREFIPDIILLDVMMPDMDGFEVCKQIKSDKTISHIPVVMVTALSDVEDRVKGLKAGADDFLTKPINDNALFARIKSLVRLKNITDELIIRKRTDNSLGLFNDDMYSQNINIEEAKILFVEDDIIQVKNLSEYLEKLGHHITTIQNPEAVAEEVKKDNFDLIIISTQLSGFDGLRLCMQLRVNEHTRNTPILITIEEDDTTTLVKGFEIGANDYIVHPFDYNELTARIYTQIRKKRYQDLLKQNFERSVSMAMTDGLTGCYNRRYFDTYLINKISNPDSNSGLSLIMLDIDNFKKINDNYGHQVGDYVLKVVSEIINTSVRSTDLVARYGGEEFVLVMPDSSKDLCNAVAERIRSKVELKTLTIQENNIQINCTISVGTTIYFKGDTSESLIERADKALYEAKGTGKNKIVFNERSLSL